MKPIPSISSAPHTGPLPNPRPLELSQQIAAVVRDDPGASDALLARLLPLLRARAREFAGHSIQDHDDMVSRALVWLGQELKTDCLNFDPTQDTNATAYFRTITRRLMYRAHRHFQAKKNLQHVLSSEGEDPDAVSSEPDGLAQVEFSELAKFIQKWLGNQPNLVDQQIFFDHLLGRKSSQELATLLDMTPQAVDKRVERLRARLKQDLLKQGISLLIGIIALFIALANPVFVS